MNKPLLGSIALATLLFGDASAATIYERFEAMEKEMQGLQSEVTDLRAKQTAAEEAAAKADDEEEDEPEDESADDEESEDEDEEEEDINEVIEEMQEEITELTKATSGSHLKLGVDFRTSYDSVHYEMADGSKYKNNDILTNRLWLNMNWAANENISFTGQLAYNKTYGQRFGIDPSNQGAGFEAFDWVANENPGADGTVRVKSAYWFYRNDTLLGADIPWTFSIGRRPSTNGHLINLRDDDTAASPSGHGINVEFDGLSSKLGLENLTGVEGMYVKFCAGQGATNATEKFSPTPYADNTADPLKDIHLAGLIFVPYDNGQFSVGTQFYGASNVPGQSLDFTGSPFPGPGFNANFGNPSDLVPVGDFYNGSMYIMTNGIGDEWSDFLDDTTFFASGSISRTNPDDGLDTFGQEKSMFGSTEMKTGYSYWVGLNMPSLISEDGRFGLEFNHGSKYWGTITYAEDTLIGSKIAARGNAYEAYFTEPLLDDILSLQIRYTYIDYDYAGGDGFFGSYTGNSMSIEDAALSPAGADIVDKSQDVRVYLRYRY